MPTRIDQGLFEDARAAGRVRSRSASQQLQHWARLGRELESIPQTTIATIDRVLAGTASYDDLDDSAQSVVRAAWDAMDENRVAQLDYTDRLRASGRPWAESDEDGNLVKRDA